jgi:ATP-dependent Lon protease
MFGENGEVVLPVKDLVLFPGMIVPVVINRGRILASVDEAMRSGRSMVVVAQRDGAKNPKEPRIGDFYDIGVRCQIMQLARMNDGSVKITIEAGRRVRISDAVEAKGVIRAMAETLPDDAADWPHGPKIDDLMRSLSNSFQKFLRLNRNIEIQGMVHLDRIDNPFILIDSVVMTVNARVDLKQAILEEDSLEGRLEKAQVMVETEIDIIRLDERVRKRARQKIDQHQREYYLTEQLHAIQKELGGEDEDGAGDIEKKLAALDLPREAMDRARSELKKLKSMQPHSAESTVVRNYLEWICDIPWSKKSDTTADVDAAEETLNAEHYALDKVKERVLEFLSVQNRVGHTKGTILCFVGPPGVGKTSLGRAISKATGRVFEKISLGGLRDEAEIRGHRRTYIGSQPGKIISTMKKAGVVNPLVMLDEIDKMSADSYHGDPASAMLEVLDPEQNSRFDDLYLDVPYDLSRVMFIATANTYSIPKPLLDRMEIIELSGYTEDEKLEIARRHIMPKVMLKNGLGPDEIYIGDAALRDIIRYYTRESGVRSLERQIDRVMRKVVRSLSKRSPDLFESGAGDFVRITPDNLKDYIGIRKYDYGRAEESDAIGLVNGLAWTEVGGELLSIESSVMEGKGAAIFTGKLGDVMKESIETAKSFVRSRSAEFGINPKIWPRVDIHVHVPEGATPKDGPSAGIAMMTSIVSTLAEIPVKKDVAMTGEITLRGRVLPIGGLKEKLLAALRGGIKTAIIPWENRKDLEEMPEVVKKGLNIVPVKTAEEVLPIALSAPLKPIAQKGNFFENILSHAPVAPVVEVG